MQGTSPDVGDTKFSKTGAHSALGERRAVNGSKVKGKTSVLA